MKFFQELHNLKSISQSKGEVGYPIVGIVTDNKDPLNQRRLKAVTAAKGGTVETDWLRCKYSLPGIDNPLPKIGQLITIEYIDANPHLGVWTGVVVNQSNQPLDKVDVQNDRMVDIPGNDTITAGETVRIQNKAGAFIELNALGYVLLGDAFGNRWMLERDGINLSGGSLNISDVDDVTINNKSVATIGATDTRGDRLVNRGY